MKTGKQKIILTTKILCVVFVALIIAFYFFRDAVLQQTIAKVSNEMEIDYNSTFSVKKASFEGMSGIDLSEIVVAPKNADTLFKIQKLKTTVNLWQLAIGNVQLGTLEIKNGFVQLVKKGKVRNFDAFLKKDRQTEIGNEKRNYAQFAYRIISKALNLVPTDMILENLSFRLDDNGKKATINFQKLRLVNKQL
ncbi:MAG TPA: glycosyl transferase, partial [Flavobacterium sp.]